MKKMILGTRALGMALSTMLCVLLLLPLFGCGAGAPGQPPMSIGTGGAGVGGAGVDGGGAGGTGGTGDGPLSLAVVVGAHANAPQVKGYARLDELLAAAAQSRGYLAFVTVEGSPRVFDDGGSIVGSDAPSQRLRDEENAAWVDGLNQLLTGQVQATTPEVDTLEALRLANRALSVAPVGQRRIVVIDSGLSTSGALDFRQDGMLFAQPSDVVTYLESIKALVDFGPGGVSVDWFSLGDLAAPQAALTNRQRANLEEIWRQVIEAGGGEVLFHSQPPSSIAASAALPTVSLVDIEPEPLPELIGADQPQPVIFDESVLHFIPDTNTFIDADAARALLAPYAQQIAANPSLHVHVIGTTAECEPQYSYELSWSRAGIVVQTLTELGAPAGQLTPEGQGWFDQWHLSEVDENGIYLPGNAAKNRKVVLVLASSEHGCVL